jgi:hypothetical protein
MKVYIAMVGSHEEPCIVLGAYTKSLDAQKHIDYEHEQQDKHGYSTGLWSEVVEEELMLGFNVADL